MEVVVGLFCAVFFVAFFVGGFFALTSEQAIRVYSWVGDRTDDVPRPMKILMGLAAVVSICCCFPMMFFGGGAALIGTAFTGSEGYVRFTDVPSLTPMPSDTPTAGPSPTNTPLPTNTALPTVTYTPSSTPTEAPSFNDAQDALAALGCRDGLFRVRAQEGLLSGWVQEGLPECVSQNLSIQQVADALAGLQVIYGVLAVNRSEAEFDRMLVYSQRLMERYQVFQVIEEHFATMGCEEFSDNLEARAEFLADLAAGNCLDYSADLTGTLSQIAAAYNHLSLPSEDEEREPFPIEEQFANLRDLAVEASTIIWPTATPTPAGAATATSQ